MHYFNPALERMFKSNKTILAASEDHDDIVRWFESQLSYYISADYEEPAPVGQPTPKGVSSRYHMGQRGQAASLLIWAWRTGQTEGR